MPDSGDGEARLVIPPAELSSLSGIERHSLLLARWLNASRWQPLAHWVNTQVHRRWILWAAVSRRLHIAGLDELLARSTDRGVLLASNHRSFFDQYIIACCIYARTRRWSRFYFPVRSGFFYDHPLGVLLNLVVWCTMFPPVFRPREQRGVTRAGLDFLAAQLQSPHTLVGIHPEGTRGKGPDPYQLLRPEPGFGKVVLQARPIVVPIFINGLSNNPLTEIGQNLRGRPPVTVVYGEPLDLSAFDDADPTLLRNQVKVGQAALAEVARLAERERQLRASLEGATA